MTILPLDEHQRLQLLLAILEVQLVDREGTDAVSLRVDDLALLMRAAGSARPSVDVQTRLL